MNRNNQKMIIWKRKLYRIVVGSIFPAAYLITGRPAVPLMLTAFFLALLSALEYERRRNPKVWEYLLGKAGGVFKKQPGKLTGDTYFILAVFLILMVFSKDIAIAALFFLVFGDAGSAVIGTRYGRTAIFRGKTIEGLAGGILFNLIIALIILPALDISVLLLLAGAITASVMEVLPLFNIDDNLTVGLSSALVMFLLSSGF